jgi:TPR repeat protein
MLREGKGLAKDDKQATMWFRRAAESGGEDTHWETLGERRQAQAELGYAYMMGHGIEQSDNEVNPNSTAL